jgi:hypothetical protein
MAEVKKLNLDELFGQSNSVKVTQGGRDYELMRIEALGPKQAVQLQKMQKKADGLKLLNEEMTDQQALDMESTFDDMIRMLCPDFPIGEITFLMKMRILTFYMEQTQGKKAMETALKNMTGRKGSRK